MTKRINIIDADTIAFASAAQAQDTSILATHIETGRVKEFKNITELKEVMKSKGTLDRMHELSIETRVEPQRVEFALSNAKNKLKFINDAVQADKTIIVLGGKSTYRQSLALPSPYKNNRADKPVHLQACKEYMINKHKAYLVDVIETDDEVTILAEEYKVKGWDVVLSSPDHDSFQMHGITLFNYKESEIDKAFVPLNSHSFQVIRKGTYNKSIGSGVGYLAGQCLYGDPTDTYNPTEIAGIKYGMISAMKDLSTCVEPKDFLEVVKRKYQEWYPEPVTYRAWNEQEYTKDWKGILQMYFQAAYMLRSRDDKASAEEFFDYYGVKL